jgi:hypothetical protein
MHSTRETARRIISQIARLHRRMTELANDIHSGGKSAAAVYIAEDNQPYETTSKRLIDRYWGDILFLWELLEDCGIKGPTINQALYQLQSLYEKDEDFDLAVFEDYYPRHAESPFPLDVNYPGSDKRLALVQQELGRVRMSLDYALEEAQKRDDSRRISRCLGTIYFNVTPKQLVIYCLLDIAAIVMELEKYGIRSDAFEKALEKCESILGHMPSLEPPTAPLERSKENVRRIQ